MKSYLNKHQFLVIAILLVAWITPASAQNLESSIDSILLEVFKNKNEPGGVVMVAEKGNAIYQKAFGKANLDLNVDLSTESVFQLGSMTKQFTAIAILMLFEQGKLKLTDPISNFIPNYPDGNQITLHHLLTHTSGIKDFTKMKTLNSIAQNDLSPKEMVNFFKDEPVDFLPGEKFQYNNSGYVVLGYVIELVSGETYEDYINNHIFKKIGMSNSRYGNDNAIVVNRAYGYQKRASGYVNKSKINFSIPFSSGALMSTATDMLKWQNALTHHLLLKSSSIKHAFASYQLNNGDDFNYGYGWHIKDVNGTPTREHGGSIFGFKTMGVYIPIKNIYILILTNCDDKSPTLLAKKIAELVVVH